MTTEGAFRDYLRSRVGTERGVRKRLAESIPVDPATITSYISGRLRPRAKHAIAIAQFFGDDPVAVLQMLGHDSVAEAIIAEADKIFIRHGVAESGVDYSVRQVPVLGRLAVGSESVEFFDDGNRPPDMEEYMKVPNIQDGAYVIVIESNDLEPLYPKGTRLIASPLNESLNGRPHIVQAKDGRRWIRTVYTYDEHYVLIGPSAEPMSLTKDQVDWLHPIIWIKYP